MQVASNGECAVKKRMFAATLCIVSGVRLKKGLPETVVGFYISKIKKSSRDCGSGFQSYNNNFYLLIPLAYSVICFQCVVSHFLT